MKNPASHIFEFTPDTLKKWCADRNLPAFRATQILEWVYHKGVCDPALMSNLSKRDRDLLAAELAFLTGEVVSHQQASDGTQKLLIQWEDQESRVSGLGFRGSGESDSPESSSADVRLPLLQPENRNLGGSKPETRLDSARQTECVMIPAGGTKQTDWNDGDDEPRTVHTRVRRTACISSQIGCPVGCKFCASGIGGLDGNLTAGRIIEQIWRLGRLPGVDRITNVVFMGMGEPLSNYANVTRAIRTLSSLWATGIGARRITISTVGMPKAIEKLADDFELPVTLALSLHAPNDSLRRELIPWAEYSTIAELLRACQKWFEKTGREITLEYILLGGVNDKPEHARQLADLAKTLRANVNLIRYNEVKGMPFDRPKDAAVLEFQKILRERGVNVHIRASRGRDIAAACGQLRHEKTTLSA